MMMMMMTQFDARKLLSIWLLLLLGIFLALSSTAAQTTTTTKRTTTTTSAIRTTATTGTTTVKPRTQKQQEAKCQLPVEPGPCRMRLERYYYNPKTNTCETFQFGGCRGNDNKFGFRQTCEEACLLAPAKATK